MSKTAKKVLGSQKRVTEVVVISAKNYFNTKIQAQCASAAPPLGPLLGKFGLNISNFCKNFNEKTQNYKKGIPLPVTVRINPDRSFKINLHTPPISYYLMQAAGINKGKLIEETKSGEITLKHIYEIAKIKYEDPYSKYQVNELEEVVRHVVGLSKAIGLEIVKEIDPVQYKEFLTKRKEFVQKVLMEIEEEKKLKLQRV